MICHPSCCRTALSRLRWAPPSAKGACSGQMYLTLTATTTTANTNYFVSSASVLFPIGARWHLPNARMLTCHGAESDSRPIFSGVSNQYPACTTWHLESSKTQQLTRCQQQMCSVCCTNVISRLTEKTRPRFSLIKLQPLLCKQYCTL